MPPKPSSFHDKALFLSSLNIDLLALAAAHPPLAVAPLPSIRATIDLLLSLGLTPPDLRRASGMCPEILASSPSSLLPVLTFLLREAGVAGLDLRRAIHRRPRLLISSVPARLRPTLYFLQSLGITSVARHTALLSCSVEDKLLPRLEFLQRAGFSHRDARSMVRKFPQLFCYSLDCNLKPKLEFLVGVMGRELRELREFPQFFSFSLANRIGPRHQACEEKGVFLTLPALLRPSDEEFQARLEVAGTSLDQHYNMLRSRPSQPYEGPSLLGSWCMLPSKAGGEPFWDNYSLPNPRIVEALSLLGSWCMLPSKAGGEPFWDNYSLPNPRIVEALLDVIDEGDESIDLIMKVWLILLALM